MQLRRQDNVAYASIADTTQAIPASTAGKTNAPVSPSTLAAGGAALIDEGNIGISTAAAYATLADDARLRVCENIGGKLVFSAAFTKSAIKSTTVKQFSAAQQQITRIGYNGTTGALPTTTVKTGFFIKLRKNDNDAANRSQPASLFAQFATDATGSQEELAHGLVASGIKNMSTQPAGNNGYVKFEALCDEAGAAVTGTLTHLLFTKDSTEVISCTNLGAVDNNKTITNIAVGDCIKIAAALTSPVYKVKSVTNGTATTPAKIVLTYAYQADTAIVAKGDARRILEAAHLIAEYGVQVRGVASDFDVNAFRNYYSNRFTATFSDTTVKITHVQGALDGVGVWQQVAMEEYMSMGNQGENGMLGVPPTMRTSSVITDGQYDCLQISVKEDINGLVSADKADADILVFIQDGSGSPTGLGIATALGVNTLLT